MREIRQSGSEGGVAVTRHPYPYNQAAPLALGSGMANRPVCSRINGLVRSRANVPFRLRANGPAPSQPMATP